MGPDTGDTFDDDEERRSDADLDSLSRRPRKDDGRVDLERVRSGVGRADVDDVRGVSWRVRWAGVSSIVSVAVESDF